MTTQNRQKSNAKKHQQKHTIINPYTISSFRLFIPFDFVMISIYIKYVHSKHMVNVMTFEGSLPNLADWLNVYLIISN